MRWQKAFKINDIDAVEGSKLHEHKDALVVIKEGDTGNGRRNVQEYSKGKKRERRDYLSNHETIRSKNNKTRRMVNFTSLVMPIDKILMQTKDDQSLKWPKPLNSSPNACNKKKYRRFHRDREECRDLKEQTKKLTQKRKL